MENSSRSSRWWCGGAGPQEWLRHRSVNSRTDKGPAGQGR